MRVLQKVRSSYQLMNGRLQTILLTLTLPKNISLKKLNYVSKNRWWRTNINSRYFYKFVKERLLVRRIIEEGVKNGWQCM